jgi:hypothetical protein
MIFEPIKAPIERGLNSIKEAQTAHFGHLRDKAQQKLDEVKLPPVKVSLAARVWAFLNGKKSLIGGLFYAAGEVIPGTVGLIFKIAGFVVAPIGIIHKLLKVQTKVGAKGEFGLKEILEVIVTILNQIITKMKG